VQQVEIEQHRQAVEEHIRTRWVRPALAWVPGSLPRESWRPVHGYPGVLVSDHGRMWSQSGGLLKISHADYPSLTLVDVEGRRKVVKVHRIVLSTFIGPAPAGAEGAHCNGIRTDNRLENLRWTSRAGNRADRSLHSALYRLVSAPKAPRVSKLMAERAQRRLLDEASRQSVAELMAERAQRRAKARLRKSHVE
jgi:hypothetical protein